MQKATIPKENKTLDALLIIIAMIILFWSAGSNFSVKRMVDDPRARKGSISHKRPDTIKNPPPPSI